MIPVRLAELLGRLSLAFDIAEDSAPGSALRSTVLAVELGRRIGASEETIGATYWGMLGCETVGSSSMLLAGLRRVAPKDSFARLPHEADLPVLLHRIGRDVEEMHRREGRGATLELLLRRVGGAVDQQLVKIFLNEHAELFRTLEDPCLFERFLSLEPRPVEVADAGRVEEVARGLAVFSDLTNPVFRNHSTGVAALAERAALELGLGAVETRTVRLAALLHDVGRVSVPNGIWARQGPLDWSAWERVRLHPYYTGRVLGAVDALAELADVATTAHERMDGSGYPQRRTARTLSLPARLLGAAHAAFSMSEDRPHRRALTSDGIARELVAEARAGRLETRAVDAVLACLGLPERASPRSLHGLSERELDVSQLLAQGRSDKEIAAKLHISPRTVQVHVSRILDKLGVRNRARAAVWLIEHDLAS
jgi:DNA-binding CsgD family transcriptional regulator